MSQSEEIAQAIQTIEMQGTKKPKDIYDKLQIKFPDIPRPTFRRIMSQLKHGRIIPD